MEDNSEKAQASPETEQIMEPLVTESQSIWFKQHSFEDAECRAQMLRCGSLVKEKKPLDSEIMEPLVAESQSIWFKQHCFEDAECRMQMLRCRSLDKEKKPLDCETHPLLLENIMFKQPFYESAELHYQSILSGTLFVTPAGKVRKAKLPRAMRNGGDPTWVDYGQKLDVLEKALSEKHRILYRTYHQFGEQKRKRVAEIRHSVAKLRETVKSFCGKVEEDIKNYIHHEKQAHCFLDALSATTLSVRELRQMSHKVHNNLEWKPVYSMLAATDQELNAIMNVGLVPSMTEDKDVTADVRRAVLDLKAFEYPAGMYKYMGIYPRMVTELCNAHARASNQKYYLSTHCSPKSPAEIVAASRGSGNSNAKSELKKNADGGDKALGADVAESLNGSLGDECLSGEWVSISDNLNTFLGAEGDGPVKNVKAAGRSKGRGMSSNESPFKRKLASPPRTAKLSSPLKNKCDKASKKTDGAEDLDDGASLDGSLGSEESFSGQGDLVACFVSLQKEENDKRSKSGKTLPKSSGKKKESEQRSSGSSSNQAKTPPALRTRQSESSSGGSSNSNLRPGINKNPIPNQLSPLAHYQTVAQELLQQQTTLIQRTRYEQRLLEMSKQLKQMLLVCGPSFQIQEMLSETELLHHMLYNNYIEDAFKHRLSLLQMAFNYNLRENPKLNPGTAAMCVNPNIPKPPFVATQGGGGKAAGKSRKKKKTVAPLPPPSATNNPSALAKILLVASMNPCAFNDHHRPGISSMVVLDDLKRLILVDIINGCLKLFSIAKIHTKGDATLIQTVDVLQPYYMTAFGWNRVLVSKADRRINVFLVTPDKGLELEKILPCPAQYYGLAWVKGVIVACANYEGNSIDLIRVRTNLNLVDPIASFRTHSTGPELLSVIPDSGNVVFLERVVGKSVHLTSIDPETGDRLFSLALGGDETDVWNVACVKDKIVCCSKQSNKIVLLSASSSSVEAGGNRLMMNTSLSMPSGSVKMPFAVCFNGKTGEMYVANDAAWEQDFNHYVTTQVNIYSFTTWL